MLEMINECIFRNKEESVCEKNGRFCPAHATQDDMPCGGCCYREGEEDTDA